MSKDNSVSKVTSNDVRITFSRAINVYFEDKEKTTEKKAINSVSNSAFQFVLHDELALVKGDLVRVDSGNYKGYYTVKEVSGTTVTVDSSSSNFRNYGDETYSSGTIPNLYKVDLVYNHRIIKEGQLPSKERELVEVTCFDDLTQQYETGNINYSDFTFSLLNDPYKRSIQLLKQYFDTGEDFVIALKIVTNEGLEKVLFYRVKVTKIDGIDLKFNEFINFSVTFKVSEGERELSFI